MLARLAQAVDGSLAAVEWQIPDMPPPRLDLLFAHGAVSPIAPRPAELMLSIPATPPAAAAGAVAEPVTPFAGPPPSAPRQRSSPPRSLAIRWYLIDPELPYLRFSGRWLARLGFTPGRRADVAAEPGRIVLTLAHADAAGGGPTCPAPLTDRAVDRPRCHVPGPNRDARVPRRTTDLPERGSMTHAMPPPDRRPPSRQAQNPAFPSTVSQCPR
jgi:hypothetical protein